jgi:MgtC family
MAQSLGRPSHQYVGCTRGGKFCCIRGARARRVEPNPCRRAGGIRHRIPRCGLIFREGLNVRGLNTAATLWCSAAIGVLAGAGYAGYAAIATGFVVFVNLLLRPIVSFINRQPLVSTELEIGYVVSITCRGPDEAQIRALLLQSLATSGLALRRLDSSDLDGSTRVVVTAFVRAHQRVDAEVEKIVGRLSLEPTVSAARWQAVADVDLERPDSIPASAHTRGED